MKRAAIAAFALGAAMLFPNWAAAHVVSCGEAPPLLGNDEHDQLTRETLPIVHDCPQVAATFRAQDMTEDEFDAACNLLKETEDFFHATMGTDPASPAPYWATIADDPLTVEILAFSSNEDAAKYNLAVYGEGACIGCYRAYGRIARIVLNRHVGQVLEHEYIHHLDFRFRRNDVYVSRVVIEGLVNYLVAARQGSGSHWLRNNARRTGIIDDSSSLPTLSELITSGDYEHGILPYAWGYTFMYYLFNENPQVVKGMTDSGRVSQLAYRDYLDETLPLLTDDFHRWLRGLVPITLKQIEPVAVFRGPDYYRPRSIYLADYFVTIQDLQDFAFDVSLSAPYEQQDDWLVSDIVSVRLSGTLLIIGTSFGPLESALGTVEVTVTATAPDGQSAELTVTVNVVRDLETTAITLRDAVSTEEGTTAINLENYYTGPALGEVDFTVASNKPNVALVAVRGGHLIITAVAAGEAEVTVRTDYYGRITTQTFAVTITDDCPAYLCRGFFNGWRWLLLEDGQAAATETTPTE